jgi:hypothetical protein
MVIVHRIGTHGETKDQVVGSGASAVAVYPSGGWLRAAIASEETGK